jgi:hypothetical protein
MELACRIEFHARFLRKVAASSPQVEIVWNIDDVRRSLQFLAQNGAEAGGNAARAAARIFTRTQDTETRRLCLNALYKINDKTARNELLRIYQQEQNNSDLRTAIAEHLRERTIDYKRVPSTEAKPILSISGQP